MKYANGGTPEVGDHVRFLTWAGFTQAQVERIGHFGLVKAGGVWNLAITMALVEPAALIVDITADTTKFAEAVQRLAMAGAKEDLHGMAKILREQEGAKMKVDLEYLVVNLEGCVGKLEDAQAGDFGMTWERAGRDCLDPLKTYTGQLRAVLDGQADFENVRPT